jgi:hypothetical protein
MGHRRQLIRRQLRDRFAEPGRREQPRIDRVPMDDDRGRPRPRIAVDQPDGSARPTVAPGGRPAREHHVGRPAELSPDPGRPDAVPPDRFAGLATVVGVGPHEELEALPLEREAGIKLVGRALFHLGRPQHLRRDGQFDDDTLPPVPRLVEDRGHRRHDLRR